MKTMAVFRMMTRLKSLRMNAAGSATGHVFMLALGSATGSVRFREAI